MKSLVLVFLIFGICFAANPIDVLKSSINNVFKNCKNCEKDMVVLQGRFKEVQEPINKTITSLKMKCSDVKSASTDAVKSYKFLTPDLKVKFGEYQETVCKELGGN
jgi:hypothetical protein